MADHKRRTLRSHDEDKSRKNANSFLKITSTSKLKDSFYIRSEVKREIEDSLDDSKLRRNALPLELVTTVMAEASDDEIELRSSTSSSSDTNADTYPTKTSGQRESRDLKTDEKESPFVCKVCKKTFSKKKLLSQHSSIHTDNYKCDCCGRKCTSSNALSRHQQTHVSEKSLACKVCQRAFSSIDSLRKHSYLHTDRYKCTLCEKSCSSKNSLNQHMQTHIDSDKTFSCEDCQKRFTSTRYLNCHRLVHTDQYKCSLCNKTFSSNYTLQDHLQIHSGSGNAFKCNVCPKTFSKLSYLKKHQLIHTDLFKCEFCDRSCASKPRLELHIKTVHPSAEDCVTCEVCDKQFLSKITLKKHLNIHSDRFTCNVCKRQFMSNSDLGKHLSVHLSEKYFPCEVCHASFKSETALKKHGVIHTDVYQCVWCNRRCRSKHELKRHVGMVHSCETGFECDACKLLFTCREHLQLHASSVHAESYQHV